MSERKPEIPGQGRLFDPNLYNNPLPGSAGAFGTRNQNPIKAKPSQHWKDWDVLLGAVGQMGGTPPDRGKDPRRVPPRVSPLPPVDFVPEPPHHIAEEYGVPPTSDQVTYTLPGHEGSASWKRLTEQRGLNPETDIPTNEDWGQQISVFKMPVKKLPMNGQFDGYH